MKVLVTGATSMVGDFLLPMLVDAGHEVVATSRRGHPRQAGVTWYCLDISKGGWFEQLSSVDIWIHLAGIRLLGESLQSALESLQVRRLIVFSSTSRYTKQYARGERDRNFARQLARGEQLVEDVCGQLGIGWNIIRPTLIYCLGRDKNLSLIRHFIRRFRFFPIVGSGEALRQPVHARDLAYACLALIEHPECANRSYNLSGGEVLSYQDMVTRLFERLNMRPRFVHVPVLLLRSVIAVLRIWPRYRYLTMDMADRMAMDMVFSHRKAARDFGYRPGPFRP